ncbi:hypothetical protein EOK76_g2533 [Lacticaseibacillus paracasei]|nr:hypothetical protein EOK76_g2533 [Lacticaseibacillus paracasei]
MMNCHLEIRYNVKIASRYRTIFGKQLRLLWSKRERFSLGKRAEKSELRTNRPQKRLDRNKRILRVI